MTARTEGNIQKTKYVMRKDRRVCIRMISDIVNTNKETKFVQKWRRKTSLRNIGGKFARKDSQKNKTCSLKSSQVMKLGFSSTTRKQSVDRCIGRAERRKARLSKSQLKAD
ncbi:hypothetical protein J437_LFUL002550, partial [Ladona fulva]